MIQLDLFGEVLEQPAAPVRPAKPSNLTPFKVGEPVVVIGDRAPHWPGIHEVMSIAGSFVRVAIANGVVAVFEGAELGKPERPSASIEERKAHILERRNAVHRALLTERLTGITPERESYLLAELTKWEEELRRANNDYVDLEEAGFVAPSEPPANVDRPTAIATYSEARSMRDQAFYQLRDHRAAPGYDLVRDREILTLLAHHQGDCYRLTDGYKNA